MRRAAFLVAGIVGAVFVSGCAGYDIDENPLYVGRVRELADRREARTITLGPLFDDAKTTAPGGDERTLRRRETALHPLWRRVATPDASEVQVLDPLYNERTTAEKVEHRILMLSWSRSRFAQDTSPEYDYALIPLLFFGWGATADERYFALFPLGGTIKDFIGFAEFTFFLFPIYYEVRKEVSSPETLHNVTPFIGWTTGGPRGGSWHFLPFFGHWKWEGKYDKHYLLWPFFSWGTDQLDTPDPATLRGFWPFFLIDTSASHSYRKFLWPLFRFDVEHVTQRDESGAPREEVYFETDAPWPLYRHQHTRKFDRLRLFPFYSRYRSPEIDSDAWAIPLFWKRQERRPEWTKDTFDFVPFFHDETTKFKAREETDRSLRLWPLFGWKREAGAEDLKVPALLPLDIERYTGDFEANWGPLFELWHEHRDADGARHGNSLLRFVDWDVTPERRRFSLPVLYAGDWTAQRSTHDLLLGALRVGGGEGGLELKFLGMPIVTPSPPATPEREVRTR